MYKIGDRVVLIDGTPNTEYDPHSNDGANYYNDKYPPKSIGFVSGAFKHYATGEWIFTFCGEGHTQSMFDPIVHDCDLSEISNIAHND